MKLKSVLFFFFCILFVFTLKASDNNRIKGVKIYEYKGDLNKLFKEFKTLGINTVLVGEQLSKNKEFYTIAKRFGIKTFVVFPVFCSPDKPFADKSFYAVNGKGNIAKDEWVHFACPTNVKYRKNKLDELQYIIKTYHPDGISVDFIRYFVYWEKVFPNTKIGHLENTCFCDRCMEKYESEIGVKFPSDITEISDKANWILKHHKEEWVNFKTDIIASFVKEISVTAKSLNPNILINLHIIPWRADDFNKGIKTIAGQDIKKMAKYADYISPMCYWHMVKRAPNWIASVIDDMVKLTDKPIIPSIQVNSEYSDRPINFKEFKTGYKNITGKNSAGVIFWKWGFFEAQPEKKKIFNKKYPLK